MNRPKAPAPPDPGIIPGGIRDRATRAVLARGPIPEDKAKTKAAQEYWAKVREPRLIRETVLKAEHLIIRTFALGGHRYMTSVEDVTGSKLPTVNYYDTEVEALRLHDSSVQVIEEGTEFAQEDDE